MDELVFHFLPYCDNEYANRHCNAENCAEVSRAYTKRTAVDFLRWFMQNEDDDDSTDPQSLDELYEIYLIKKS